MLETQMPFGVAELCSVDATLARCAAVQRQTPEKPEDTQRRGRARHEGWSGSFRLEPDGILAAILYRDPTVGGVHDGEPLLEVLQRVADVEVELHTASDENESAIFDLLIFGRRKKPDHSSRRRSKPRV